MGHRIDAGGGGKALGGAHVQVRVHDGHIGHQLIVGQRIFHAGLLVVITAKGVTSEPVPAEVGMATK